MGKYFDNLTNEFKEKIDLHNDLKEEAESLSDSENVIYVSTPVFLLTRRQGIIIILITN